MVVAMRNPLKQGLKHLVLAVHGCKIVVAMRNPLKQGLKQSDYVKGTSANAGRNAKSTKTRIETYKTYNHLPPYDGRNAKSTKTRIETKEMEITRHTFLSRNAKSTKTRIETLKRFFLIPTAMSQCEIH